MKFRGVRNGIAAGLGGYLGIPVCLGDQTGPEPEFPFVVYSATAPYIPENGLGEISYLPDGFETLTERRREEPLCTFSFTVCGKDRRVGNGYILGDDEALELAEKAQGWFLHAGYDDISQKGITVVDVSNVQGRSFLQVDEEARRYGFDVTLRYVRTDKRTVGTVGLVSAAGKGESLWAKT